MKLEEIKKQFIDRAKKLEPGQSKLELGKLLVEARLNHFIRPDGHPDFQGRSMDYRRWIGETLDALNLQGEERLQFTSSLRYATGNALREVLTDEQLELAGLKKTSPKDRGKTSYEKVANPYNISRKAHITEESDVDTMIEVVRMFMVRIDDPKLLDKFVKGITPLKNPN